MLIHFNFIFFLRFSAISAATDFFTSERPGKEPSREIMEMLREVHS